MTTSRVRCAFGLVVLVVSAGALPGCVVWEIRDGIRESNSNVAESSRRVGEATAQVELARNQVAEASAEITRANVAIETANQRIVTVESQIAKTEARIESTERRIESVEGTVENRIVQLNRVVDEVQPKLDRLHSISDSLVHIDAHLRSVRKTLNSLSDQMPFFELEADPIDSVPAPAGVPGVAPEGAAPPPAAAPGAEYEGAPATGLPAELSRPKRELLLGTWLREHPSAGVALILLEDGVYILDANGPESERGTWRRDGTSVIMTPTTPSAPLTPGGPAAPPHAERKYTVLGRTTRVLTLDGEGGVLVFSRP